MQSKRDYLISKGLAKPGRGKFSNVAKEELTRVMASGMKFADSVTPTVSSAKTPTEKSAGGQTDPTFAPYLTADEYRFPLAEYRGVTYVDGKKVDISLKECCNTCMVSLVNHMCDAPTVFGDVTVKIVRR